MNNDDYRCSLYCPSFDNVKESKRQLLTKIKNEHSRAKNIYKQVSESYKSDFVKCYNQKCAYCGVIIEIAGIDNFEIDHYICQNDSTVSEEEKNSLPNLALACRFCNRKKGSFLIPSSDRDLLDPDTVNIKKVFLRNGNFEISVAPEYQANAIVKKFYDKIQFGNLIRQVDFVLVSIYRLIEKSNNTSVKKELQALFSNLLIKRNVKKWNE